MDWFYAINKQQQGPVDSATLRTLFQGGTINSETLVWHAGLDGWKPYTEIATSLEADTPAPTPPQDDALPDFMKGDQRPAPATAAPASMAAAAAATSAAVAPQDKATCAYCGTVAPKKDMLRYGEHWLLPEHKDAFVASLQQGTAVMPGEKRTNLQPVGFWWRVLAYLIDSIIVGTGSLICAIPFFLLGGLPLLMTAINNPEALENGDFLAGSMAGIIIGAIIWVLLALALMCFYYIYLVGKNGGTPGKRLLGFRIVTYGGENITYGRATGRFCATFGLAFAGSLIAGGLGGVLMVGMASAGDAAATAGVLINQFLNLTLGNLTYLWVAFDKKKRGLHDLIASTLVIRD